MNLQNFLVVCAASLIGGASAQAAPELFLRQTVLDSVPLPTTVNRTYRLLLPMGLAEKPGEKFPLVIYLHGGGSRGDDNTAPITEELPKHLATPALRERFPCFILVPQCRDGAGVDGRPNNWVKWQAQEGTPPALWVKSDDDASDQLRAAMAACEDVVSRQPIDRSRIYLTGVSMGATGAWAWASRQPDRFSALLTVNGLTEISRVEPIARLPVWTFQGAKDEVMPAQRMRDFIGALKAAGSPVTYTEYPEADHAIASQALTENDFAAFTWLFAQRK